jgi:hypothetical protein
MLSTTRDTAIADSIIDLYREKVSGDILSRTKDLLLAFKDNMVTSVRYGGGQDQEELFDKSNINVYKNMMSVVPTCT